MRSLKQSGDTIIEVMVSMTILAMIMGVAFATSRHSLQAGLDASYRDQAQSYAQQQVELIKELDATDGLTATFQDTVGFCINPVTRVSIPVHDPTPPCSLPIGGPSVSQFTVLNKYSGNGPGETKTYTIVVQWPSSSSDTPNQVTVHYKASNSFANCNPGETCFNNAPHT